jgi:hypothetical protein
MTEPIRILGIAGSLRQQSFNRAALRAAQQLAPTGTAFETFELEGIPPFNQDKEREPPQAVVQFKQAILRADAILFVTPEYNYSIPGVLKNAIGPPAPTEKAHGMAKPLQSWAPLSAHSARRVLNIICVRYLSF